jgi:hypothetical protein
MHGRNVLRRRVVDCDMTVEGVEEERNGPTLGAVRALDSLLPTPPTTSSLSPGSLKVSIYYRYHQATDSDSHVVTTTKFQTRLQHQIWLFLADLWQTISQHETDSVCARMASLCYMAHAELLLPEAR